MHWNAKQTYIALGFAMMACASLSIDSCPIEGFNAKKYSQILKLSDKGLTPNVVLAIGYAQDSESAQRSPKVRLDTSDFFLTSKSKNSDFIKPRAVPYGKSFDDAS